MISEYYKYISLHVHDSPDDLNHFKKRIEDDIDLEKESIRTEKNQLRAINYLLRIKKDG